MAIRELGLIILNYTKEEKQRNIHLFSRSTDAQALLFMPDNTFTFPQPCQSSLAVPTYSSHKAYVTTLKEYVPPGSFLILKGCSHVVFQLLEVTTDMPEELFERSALNPNSHILKLSAYELSHSLSGINIAQLRQRSVRDMKEVVKTNKISYALDIDIESICFIFHAEEILSDKYDCEGIDNAYLIRYELNSSHDDTVVLQADGFLSFPYLTD